MLALRWWKGLGAAKTTMPLSPLVHASLDAGVNFFDTAEGYSDDSNSEEVLGRALEGRRGDAVIATKIGNAEPPSVSGIRALRREPRPLANRLHRPVSDSLAEPRRSDRRTRWPSC